MGDGTSRETAIIVPGSAYFASVPGRPSDKVWFYMVGHQIHCGLNGTEYVANLVNPEHRSQIARAVLAMTDQERWALETVLSMSRCAADIKRPAWSLLDKLSYGGQRR